MDADLQELRAAYARQARRTEPPQLDELEALCRLLSHCASKQGDNAGSVAATLGDESSLLEQLQALTLGSAPTGLHELVEREWTALEKEWASFGAMKAFDERMMRLLQPFGQVAADNRATADEIARQRERLNALRALAELLDELIEDAPVRGTDATLLAEG